ncbi:MAG: hypothetical protein LAO79_03060 [Acidobacteriia bacterium]|nr:hypothetical protein [Terriglobia bacterium]
MRSRHEKSVKSQLDAKDKEAFLPLYSARHKWADRSQTVSLPLFPGYVFCRFTPADRSAVMTTSGIIDVVRIGTDPAPLPEHEIDAIRRVVNSPLLTEPYAGLARGQEVVVVGGPLAGIHATVTEVKKNLRLVLSVDLLQRSVLVEIERDWVIPHNAVKLACDMYGHTENICPSTSQMIPDTMTHMSHDAETPRSCKGAPRRPSF